MIITIKEFNETKYKEKGSVFIGQIFPVTSETGAEKKLTSIRKKYYDATHHCYAWKIHSGDEKYSDDGEPNGTAGIRIFNALEHFSLTDILAVVIRYYGGTKLGVGPLGKAYYQSAYDTLSTAKKIELNGHYKMTVRFNFDLSSPVYHILSRYEAQILETVYQPEPAITAFIKTGLLEKAEKELIAATAGKANVVADEKVFYI